MLEGFGFFRIFAKSWMIASGKYANKNGNPFSRQLSILGFFANLS